ncbi:MAG TPA: fused MFS/spermidine synthase [Geminicoccaceae bacterium]|nr:fused MFS/spermidine synthase [Geminicoccaceae bacterium]
MASVGDQRLLAVAGGGERPGILPLFAATLFVSALLLFWIQPMFSRMVLPTLGGSPAVWNTAMVFCQTALLAGYLYAHLVSRWLSLRRQVAFHLAFLALAALTLPIAIGPSWAPPTEGTPVLWLIGLLAWCLGLPFLVVSATAPLLQKWFAASGHPAGRDPYFLYGASNLGSMLALLGYPLLLEPFLTIARQNEAWTLGYAALAALVAICGLAVWRRPRPGDAFCEAPAQGAERAVGWRRRLHWLALSFAPSSLLLAVTAYITTDLASVPLLWVLPLSLYLLTFVIVFARRPVLRDAWMVKAQPFVVILLALLFSRSAAFWLVLPLHLLAFFVTAMVCHGELARQRPATSHLTEFYLWMAFGGMLGGAFNALLAPIAFDWVVEYPLALVVACLLRPTFSRARGGRLADLGLPLAALLLMLLQVEWRRLGLPDAGGGAALLLVPVGMLLYSFAARPLRFGLGVAAVLGVVLLADGPNQVEARARSFFGVYTVRHDPTGYRVLVHGTTVHGAQRLDPEARSEPLTYYHRDGPLGQIFAALEDRPARSVGAVGLGVGTVACYRRPGQRWTFFEIDPLVEQIARDSGHFHYLEDCAPAAEVVLGDARRSLQAVPGGQFDLIILDAFSSDAIPVHLLTREAMALYLDKLAPGGLIALHISNRNLDLAPVVAALLADAGLAGRVQTLVPPPEAQRAYRNAATWVAIARGEAELGAIADDPRWRRMPATAARPWTDDFSNLIGALRWRW